MDAESLREYCLSKPGTEECLPFDDTTLVIKVMGKMFILLNLEGELRMNLKCEPERAIILREHHECVLPGYHMSKTHWNTILIDGSVPEKLLKEWIDHSYDLVVSKLTRKQQALLSKLSEMQ
jgi:predicted DNA-binding protein (MmcQ/YjbR family)